MTFTPVGRVLPYFPDNPAVVHWDRRVGKYVVFTRAFDYDSPNQRRVGRIETADPLRPWPFTPTAKHRIFPSVHNIPVVYSADKGDDPHSDVYYNAAEPYPWADGAYLMFPAHFRHFSPLRHPFVRPRVKGQWEDYGMLEVQLAVSRDGVNWARPERAAYIRKRPVSGRLAGWSMIGLSHPRGGPIRAEGQPMPSRRPVLAGDRRRLEGVRPVRHRFLRRPRDR